MNIDSSTVRFITRMVHLARWVLHVVCLKMVKSFEVAKVLVMILLAIASIPFLPSKLIEMGHWSIRGAIVTAKMIARMVYFKEFVR